MNSVKKIRDGLFGPGKFYKNALSIAVPIMLQQLIQSMVSLVDNFMVSGLGDGKEAIRGGLDYAINNGGKALLLGVDIYKLTAMHYMEGATPDDINKIYAPSEEINAKYPPDKWFMEAGHPPVKAWYTIQQMAYDRGLIKEAYIGPCKVMFFDILDVVSIYREELIRDPYGLWGLT